MVNKEYVVLAKEGLHARPAKALIKMSKNFKSNVTIVKDGVEADAKSMLGVLSLCAGYQSKITLVVSGEDETTAFEALDQFFTEDIISL